MLTITIPATEAFDDDKGEFVYTKEQTLQLEHSLLSISKWESKWCKPFLEAKRDKTSEEVIDYIKCMTLNKNVSDDVYHCLTQENISAINDYIGAPMTATYFSNTEKGKKNSEQITSELVYYWMIALNIPFDPCQKWHINRLLTLIRVCNVKNQPPKKMSKRATANQYAQLNAARRQKFNSKG